jgi:hypothetical protein
LISSLFSLVTRLAGPFQRLTGLTESMFLNRHRGSAMRAGCYVRIGSAILPSMRTPLTSKRCLILFFIFWRHVSVCSMLRIASLLTLCKT